jgi:hypothetical protein
MPFVVFAILGLVSVSASQGMFALPMVTPSRPSITSPSQLESRSFGSVQDALRAFYQSPEQSRLGALSLSSSVQLGGLKVETYECLSGAVNSNYSVQLQSVDGVWHLKQISRQPTAAGR